MPVCSYFLLSHCTRDNCPYRHVNVNKDAAICEDFLKGYCAEGDQVSVTYGLTCWDATVFVRVFTQPKHFSHNNLLRRCSIYLFFFIIKIWNEHDGGNLSNPFHLINFFDCNQFSMGNVGLENRDFLNIFSARRNTCLNAQTMRALENAWIVRHAYYFTSLQRRNGDELYPRPGVAGRGRSRRNAWGWMILGEQT